MILRSLNYRGCHNCHFLRDTRQTVLFLWLQHLFTGQFKKNTRILDTLELIELDRVLTLVEYENTYQDN